MYVESFQDVLNSAYSRRFDGLFIAFVRSLPRGEAFAVTIGKLHQQIKEGGFHLWLENRYADAEAGDTLLSELAFMVDAGNPRATQILSCVQNARDEFDDYERWSEDWGDGNRFLRNKLSVLDQLYLDIADENWFLEIWAYLKMLVDAPPETNERAEGVC